MPVELKKEHGGKLVIVTASGKLTKDDYDHFVPEINRLIKEHGKVRVLLEMHDFHGWTLGALWEDVKFDMRHFRDIERLAMVGEKKWEQAMAWFCKPFTTAAIRYFDRTEADKAREWIEEQMGTVETTR